MILGMDDTALIAVVLRGPRDGAVRHLHELLLAIDVIGDAGSLVLGEEEIAAVLEGFRRIATRDEDRRAEHLGVSREAERDRRPFGRERGSRLLGRKRRGREEQDRERGQPSSHSAPPRFFVAWGPTPTRRRARGVNRSRVFRTERHRPPFPFYRHTRSRRKPLARI